MEALFTWLNHSVEAAPLVALWASLAWGVLSVLLSPCHLSSIPLIIGFVSEQAPATSRRALGISLLFTAGAFATIVAIGAVTASLGHVVGNLGNGGNYFVAAIFLIVAFNLLGVFSIPWGKIEAHTEKKGLLPALVLGLVFGIGLGPCTFAFMAPILAAAFRVASTNPSYSAALVLAYALGHCAVIVTAGVSAGWAQRYLASREALRGAKIMKRVSGVLLILASLYVLSKTTG